MKRTILRLTAVLLLVVLLSTSLIACAGRGKKLLTIEKDGIKLSLSVNIYELMLSRFKGSLVLNNNTVNGASPLEDSFWNYTSKFGGDTVYTYDEYCSGEILKNCKTYLAAMYLYEKQGLTLSEADKADVQKQLKELLDDVGGGSKAKLNAVLADYGVNYSILEEVYTMYAKAMQLQKHLYGENASNIGTDVKDEYLRAHYLHFKQIYLPNTKFVYEKDDNGDVIYYYTSGANKDHIYYDTGNGIPAYNEDGSERLDKNGDRVYVYKNSERIAYNTVHGKPVNVMNGSSYKVEAMTNSELTLLKERADSIYNSLKDSTPEKFEETYDLILEEYTKQDPVYANSDFEDGFYIRNDIDYLSQGDSYDYLDKIVKEFATMEVGDILYVTSNSGYHIVMKCDLPSAAYDNEVNETWFSGFNDSIVEEMFLAECEKYFTDITVDQKVLKKAPTMKEVAANTAGY